MSNETMVGHNRFANFSQKFGAFCAHPNSFDGTPYERLILRHLQKRMESVASSHSDEYVAECLVHVYHLEMLYHPWGRTLWHVLSPVTPKGTRQVEEQVSGKPFFELAKMYNELYKAATGKNRCNTSTPIDENAMIPRIKEVPLYTKPDKLPKCLMPTGCLNCGQDLGFSDYQSNSFKKTVHANCAGQWGRTTRPKHQAALAVLEDFLSGKFTALEVQPVILASYQILAQLYSTPYQSRWRLVPAYKDYPKTWPDTLEVEESIQDLHLMPFFNFSKNEMTEEELVYYDSETKKLGNDREFTMPDPEKASRSYRIMFELQYENAKDIIEKEIGMPFQDQVKLEGRPIALMLSDLEQYFKVPT